MESEDEMRHGTNSTYVNHLCRCEPCKAAHADAQREINQRVRARYIAQGLTANGGIRKTKAAS